MGIQTRYGDKALTSSSWVALGLAMAVMLTPACFGNGSDDANPSPAVFSTPTERPNLLFVLVDTLRADHLRYHGYFRRTSPHIDGFAAESVAFMNHYSHASRTGPSVASIFTGLHPLSHGVVNPLTEFDAKGTLAEEQTTLAEILTGEGYNCYAMVTNVNVRSRFGFGQGFSVYENLRRSAKIDPATLPIEEPFFLYLHYMEPHSPYRAAEPFRHLWVDPDYDGPVTGRHPQLDAIVRGSFVVDEKDRDQITALYDQEIRFFGDRFSELLDSLEARALLDDTIIVLTSDHGEELLDHGSVLHGYTLYEEQLRVPLVVYDPRIRDPRRVKTVTRHVDLLPTLLELMDVPGRVEFQGRSLVPFLTGREEEASAPPVFAQASLNAVKTVKRRSLMVDGWKIIETELPDAGYELYHVATDSRERRDLIEDRPAMAGKMRQQLSAFVRSLPVAEGGVVALTEEEKKLLRSLGYLK